VRWVERAHELRDGRLTVWMREEPPRIRDPLDRFLLTESGRPVPFAGDAGDSGDQDRPRRDAQDRPEETVAARLAAILPPGMAERLPSRLRTMPAERGGFRCPPAAPTQD